MRCVVGRKKWKMEMEDGRKTECEELQVNILSAVK